MVVHQVAQAGISSSSWLDGSITDFKLDRCSLSVLTNAYILVKITNSTGASTTLAPTLFWVDLIEIFNSQGNALSFITGQQLFLTLAFLSCNEFEQLASYMCLSTAYATTGTAVADGSSEVFYISLFHLLGSTKLHPAGITEELTVRMKTNVTDLTILSGSHPTVTEVALILKGYNEPNTHQEARKVAYNNKMALKLPFYNWQVVKELQTLATSTQYTVTLKGLRGPVMGLFFTLRSGPNTGSTQGTYQAISSYDIQLGTTESITGHYVKLHEDSKIENAEMFDNLFGNNKNWYFILFSFHPAEDYGTSSNQGYQAFTGTKKLVFTTNSTITLGTFQIDVYTLNACHLHIENGQVTCKA
jgi:hypothetical protein